MSLSELGWDAWGAAYWESRVFAAGSSISCLVQYWDGSTWVDVPSNVLSSSGILVPLAGLDPAVYHTIRLRLRLFRSSASNTSPSLRQIKITSRNDINSSITNGGFDDAVGMEWAIHQVGGTVKPTISFDATTPLPHGGARILKLSNTTNPNTSTTGVAREIWLQQTMQVPADTASLNFYYQAVTKQWGSPVRIYINGKTDNGWGLINPGGSSLNINTWTLKQIPMAAWAGQTITLTIGIYDVGTGAGASDHAATWSFDSFSFSP